MAVEWIGSGRIAVSLRNYRNADGTCDDSGGYVNLLCDGIEAYGRKLAFSDADGDLVRLGGEIVEASLEQVLRIRHE